MTPWLPTRSGPSVSLRMASTSALNVDDVAHAARLADLAVTITRRYENPWPIAMSLLMAGHVALVMADIDRAVGLLAEAAEVMSVLNSPLYLSWCAVGIIEVAVVRGDWELAARAASETPYSRGPARSFPRSDRRPSTGSSN